MNNIGSSTLSPDFAGRYAAAKSRHLAALAALGVTDPDVEALERKWMQAHATLFKSFGLFHEQYRVKHHTVAYHVDAAVDAGCGVYPPV